MARHSSTGGTALVAVALGLAFLGGVAGAQAPMEGAAIDDAGWWNRARPQVDLPTGPLPPPPAPGVPPGALVVGAAVGEPDAVAAVDIDPEMNPGATVESFELTLQEVDDGGANLNTPFAAVVACPITSFWIGGDNGVWETRPEFDCDTASAPGTRAEDGTWTFDLRAIGQLWADGTLPEEGVALVEAVEPPAAFRTVYEGLADASIGVRLVATGGEEPGDGFGTGGGPSGPGGGGGGSDGFGGGATGSLGGSVGSGGTGFQPPAIGSTPTTAAPATPADPAEPEPADEVALPTAPIAEPGSPLGTLPWWTWPLVAVVVAFALLAMVALGPSGEPTLAAAGGGVTRAIEARTRSEEP